MLVEMLLGHNPPFITKNLVPSRTRICKIPVESECSFFVIQESNLLEKMEIKGYIKNRNTIIPLKIKKNTKNVVFSCFDEIHLFLYYTEKNNEKIESPNSLHIFYTQFNCCRNWNIKKLKAMEINLINGSDNYIDIPITITNAREAGEHHYNIVQIHNNERYSLIFESESILMPCFQCPLCFRPFTEEKDMRYHINFIHTKYTLSITDNITKISRISDEQIKIESRTESQIGIEFYNNEFFEEDEAKSYIDFCVDTYFSEENEESIEEDTNVQPVIKIEMEREVSKRVAYKNFCTPNELVKSICLAKKAKRRGGSVVYEYRSKVLIKETSANDKFKLGPYRLAKMPRPIQELVQCQNISYFRKRESDLIDYTLKDYGLLIEREFDTLDYSDMLSKHLNTRIKEHLFSMALTPKAYKLMKTWNECFIRTNKIEEALDEMISNYGITNEVMELIELIYTRGLLDSEEILHILNKVI